VSSTTSVTVAPAGTNQAGRGRLAATEDRLRGLLAGGLAGDAAAYHAFLRELSAHLRGFFRRRMARMPDDVEDLVQETLLAVHNQRHTFDAAQPLTPWLHAIARYKLVDCLRRRSRRDLLTEPFDDEVEVLSSSDSDAAEARRDLARLLEALPERSRMAIAYVKVQGLSVAEAARLTGMSEPGVKVAVHRGLKALAAKIRGAR
jgi:RNA polymerase sigma-70 factor (ECF subfamily)